MLKDRLKEAREKAGITQQQLADSAGVAQSTIMFLESGRNKGSTKIVDIAKTLGVSPDWLLYGKEQSNVEMLPIEVKTWDSNTPLPDDMIEVPYFADMSLSAGYGAMNSDLPYVGQKLWYSKSFIRRKNACFDKVFCIKIRGDSMEPELKEGGIVMIDMTAKNIIDGKPYAITHKGQDYIKFLRRLTNGDIRIISANPGYDTFDAPAEDVEIIGRVIEYSKEW